MRFKFKNLKLEALYTEEKNAHKYPTEVIDNYFDVIAIIEEIESEQELYNFKGLRFEKLLGQREKKGEYFLRINRQ